MTLSEATQKVTQIATQKGGKLGSTIKFRFDEGVIFLDDSISPTRVSNADTSADCTVNLSLSSFEGLVSGSMNAMTAFMTGKLKIEGDMSVAMKLSGLF